MAPSVHFDLRALELDCWPFGDQSSPTLFETAFCPRPVSVTVAVLVVGCLYEVAYQSAKLWLRHSRWPKVQQFGASYITSGLNALVCCLGASAAALPLLAARPATQAAYVSDSPPFGATNQVLWTAVAFVGYLIFDLVHVRAHPCYRHAGVFPLRIPISLCVSLANVSAGPGELSTLGWRRHRCASRRLLHVGWTAARVRNAAASSVLAAAR